jgi:hypothetical protein
MACWRPGGTPEPAWWKQGSCVRYGGLVCSNTAEKKSLGNGLRFHTSIARPPCLTAFCLSVSNLRGLPGRVTDGAFLRNLSGPDSNPTQLSALDAKGTELSLSTTTELLKSAAVSACSRMSLRIALTDYQWQPHSLASRASVSPTTSAVSGIRATDTDLGS